MYVVDNWNERIQKFSDDGTFLTKWGSYGSADGEFSCPGDIAVDSDDNVYVVDYYEDNNRRRNHRIQKFSSDGIFLTKWGSVGSGDGEFNGLEGIAVDRYDNVYVADWGNGRIQKLEDGLIRIPFKKKRE